jgi:hypothetical protein
MTSRSQPTLVTASQVKTGPPATLDGSKAVLKPRDPERSLMIASIRYLDTFVKHDGTWLVNNANSWSIGPKPARLQPVEAFRLPIPRVSDSERIEIDSLGDAHDGVIHVTARFGYMETPDIRRALHVLEPEKTDGLIAIDDTRRISCRRSN